MLWPYASAAIQQLTEPTSQPHTITSQLALRLRGKEKAKSVPPPPPPRPKTKAESGAEEKESAATVPKTIDARDDSSLSSGLTDTSFSSSEASLKLPPPPPPRRTGSLAKHPEAFVKAVVLLQAMFRGRKARKKYALMRWYRGLDKPSSSAKSAAAINSGKKETPVNRSVFLSHPVPKTKTTVKTEKASPSAGNIIFGPRSSATPVAASAIPTSTISGSDSSSSPNKNPPESARSSFTPLDFSPLERSMKAIEGAIFGSEESEEAQRCAAAAKKVLLRHTTDYIAYLNALLKAHANEAILSRNEGIDAIVNELLCFLAMKALGKGPVPSIKIHRAWRIMVQSRPFVYIEMCKAMGVSSGFSVEDERFNPEEDGHGQEAKMIKEKYESTKSAYTTLFQSNPPAEFWPSIHTRDGEVSRIPANHLEFLREENLPQTSDDIFSEIGSDAMTSVSGMTYDDDSLATMEPAALLSELQYLAEEQNIDIANLSYDSIVNDIKKLRVWVDKTFF